MGRPIVNHSIANEDNSPLWWYSSIPRRLVPHLERNNLCTCGVVPSRPSFLTGINRDGSINLWLSARSQRTKDPNLLRALNDAHDLVLFSSGMAVGNQSRITKTEERGEDTPRHREIAGVATHQPFTDAGTQKGDAARRQQQL